MKTNIPNIIAHVYNPDNQSKDELINGFVARNIVFQRLYSDIKCRKEQFPLQHCLIEGKRGMGKTSMLLRIKYEIEDDKDMKDWLIPLFLKEENYAITSLFRFWEKIAQYLEDIDSTYDGLFDKMNALYKPELTKSEYEGEIFKVLCSTLKANDKKILILADNFNEIVKKLKLQEVQRLRTILQTCKEVGIVGATSSVMDEIYEYKHPFYEFFKLKRLSGLNKEDTYKLLRKLGDTHQSENIEYILEHAPGKVESLRRLTGGVIRTIVLLYEIFAEDRDGSTFNNLEALLDRVTPLYKHIMDDLPAQQQEIVDSLAFGWDALSVKQLAERTRLESKAISAQLAVLCKNEMVEKIDNPKSKNHLYCIDERFFNIWYLMRNGRKGDKNNVIWFTKFLEDWCSPNELKDRAMKHINAIKSGTYHGKSAFYFSQAIANTSIEKELQHEILNVTKEHLVKSGNVDLANMLQDSDLSILKEAQAYYGKKDYAAALKKLLKVNENNQDNFRIARCYHDSKDYLKAEMYYLKAIDKGDYNALNNLGWLYHYEYKDFAKAETYYLKAIDMGNNNALLNLAILYDIDYKDFQKAETYYLKAVDAGDNKALNNLANLYCFKYKDFQKAENYLLKAINAGDNKSFNNLAFLYKKEIKDFAKAETYYLKAIDAGFNQAVSNLANLYENEYKDYLKAKNLFEKAIAKNNDAIFNSYAWLLFEHFPTEKENALIYAQKAVAKESNIHFLHTLACIQLWNNQPEAAFATANQFLYDTKSIEDFENDYQTFLLLAIAKKQYQFVYDYFTGEQGIALQTRNRFKPIWYALMHYMREEHPIEYLRMGSELKETVEEIVAKIDEMSVKYG